MLDQAKKMRKYSKEAIMNSTFQNAQKDIFSEEVKINIEIFKLMKPFLNNNIDSK
jgi:hypothetical protein